jgi:hypothetical protein
MRTVYAVMTGGPDWDLHGIFTDEEQAEKYKDFACPDGWVHEWEVDTQKVPEWFVPGMKLFYGFWGQLHYSDRVLFSVSTESGAREAKDWEYDPVYSMTFDDGSRQAWTKVWAKDKKEAVELLIEKLGAAGYKVTEEAEMEVTSGWKV